ncbi:MAG: HAD hydrolase-like protein [Phycisphaerae bacterium]|jgi:phosphoglycolate phosphatase-like HAD superfamily hydrolase
MTDFSRPLKDLKPTKKYLVAIDSDGCAFDAMGIKQKECFCPWMISCFGLQPVAEAARQCKEFADLFSKTRGANRHKTIVRILTELLPSHPKVKESGFEVPKFEYYCKWVNNPDSLLSNDGLKQAIMKSSNPQEKTELEIAFNWSIRVNQAIADIVKNIAPFKYVRESLEKASAKADIIICSATPTEALEREWAEHGIDKYVKVITGQEMGSKTEHLEIVSSGKYDKDKVLMVGDAIGDMNTAKQNNVLYYPINPGNEVASWKRFHDEVFDKFISGQYAGSYENKLIEEFDSCLPENPPWKK